MRFFSIHLYNTIILYLRTKKEYKMINRSTSITIKDSNIWNGLKYVCALSQPYDLHEICVRAHKKEFAESKIWSLYLYNNNARIYLHWKGFSRFSPPIHRLKITKRDKKSKGKKFPRKRKIKFSYFRAYIIFIDPFR